MRHTPLPPPPTHTPQGPPHKQHHNHLYEKTHTYPHDTMVVELDVAAMEAPLVLLPCPAAGPAPPPGGLPRLPGRHTAALSPVKPAEPTEGGQRREARHVVAAARQGVAGAVHQVDTPSFLCCCLGKTKRRNGKKRKREIWFWSIVWLCAGK